MPDRNAFQQLLRAKIGGAIGLARATSCISHQGMKGEMLERLTSGLFKPLLPADIGIGTGQILCPYTSRLSTQVDIILYDKSILPPILVTDQCGIFPIEAVLYAIEVKTTLNKTELESAHNNAERLRTHFGYKSGMRDENGKEIEHHIERIRNVIFALDSDLSPNGLNEIERYGRHFDLSTSPINAICVAGREYWFSYPDVWYGAKDVDDYDSVLGLLAGVMNTYKSVALSRGSPSLGNYIAPEANLLLKVVGKDIPQVRCDDCGKQFDFFVDVGKVDLTVNGHLVSSDPCPQCGGKLTSVDKNFITKYGRLKVPDTP